MFHKSEGICFKNWTRPLTSCICLAEEIGNGNQKGYHSHGRNLTASWKLFYDNTIVHHVSTNDNFELRMNGCYPMISRCYLQIYNMLIFVWVANCSEVAKLETFLGQYRFVQSYEFPIADILIWFNSHSRRRALHLLGGRDRCIGPSRRGLGFAAALIAGYILPRVYLNFITISEILMRLVH